MKQKRQTSKNTLLLVILVLFSITVIMVLPSAIDQYQWDRMRQATATRIAQQSNPYLAGNMTTLAYYDPLSRPYLWQNTTYNNGSEKCTFVNNMYRVRINQQGSSAYCQPQENDAPLILRNFIFEVQIQLPPQSCGGLGFRINQKTGYFAVICQQNRSLSFKREDQTGITLLESKTVAEMRQEPGQFNTIVIVANKDILQYYINGNKILDLSDKVYASGSIELGASSSSGPANIFYRNVKIWKITS